MTQEQLIRLTTIVTLISAFLLVSSKIVVWNFTGSASILAAAVDNIGDFLASGVAFFAARYAMKAPNRKFKWGHSKAEPLASLALGVFISVAALALVFENLTKIISGVPSVIVMPEIALLVVLFSIVVTTFLVLWQEHAVRETDSHIIKSDSIHYKMDLLLNAGILVAIVLQSTWIWSDTVFGLLIAIYILIHTYKEIIKQSVKQLMDAELSKDDVELIIHTISCHPEVLGYHDLRTRRSGRDRFIQVHLDLDKTKDLESAHKIGRQVQKSIENIFHRAEVIVHLDPVDADCVFKEGHRISVNDSGQKFNHCH